MESICRSPNEVQRCDQLERVLLDLIAEAHVKSLAGVDICEHESDVCFCGYHEALDRGLALLDLRTSRRDPERLGAEIRHRQSVNSVR